MSWTDDLNHAMDYIEANLDGEISIADVARQAACSEFHLQRMFPYLCGMTITDYIRQRRMSQAALELACGARVIDTAAKYGYESPTSFARAFRKAHGIAPSEAQRGNVQLKQHPRLTFSMQVKGAQAMEYRIEKRDSFRVVGHVAGGNWTTENASEKATEFWMQLGGNDAERIRRVLELRDGSKPEGLLGISFCDEHGFKGYLVGVATSAACPPELQERIVPAATYAVFDCTGPMPNAMQRLQSRILTEWLPDSGYEWAPKADVEVYLSENMTAPDYQSQVWLPIQKRRGCPGQGGPTTRELIPQDESPSDRSRSLQAKGCATPCASAPNAEGWRP